MRLQWRINPVTLKELRQMTRSRLVSSALIGFLLLELICISVVLLDSRGSLQNGRMLSELALGRDIFQPIFFLLSVVVLFCIPLYVGIRMGLERGAEHLDLQYTTALTPQQFVDGKIVSAVILILVFSSGALPFMVLSYLLRGINILMVWITVGLLLTISVCTVYGAFLLSCAATTRLFRWILLLGSSAALIALIGFTFEMVSSWQESTMRLFSLSWKDFEPFLYFLLACLTGCILVRVAAVTMLSPPLSNRDLPLRLWFTGTWLLWGVIARCNNDLDYYIIWAFYGITLFGFMLCIYSSLGSSCSRRVLANVSTVPWRRALQFPFFAGGDNGMVWSLGMSLICIMLLLIMPIKRPLPTSGDMHIGHVVIYFLYLSAYICTVRAIWLIGFRKRFTPRFVGLISSGLIILGSLLPYLLALGDYNGGDVAWEFGNIFAVFIDQTINLDFHVVYAGGWALFACLACAPGILETFQRFHPPQDITTE